MPVFMTENVDNPVPAVYNKLQLNGRKGRRIENVFGGF